MELGGDKMTNERQVIVFVAHWTHRNDECDEHDEFLWRVITFDERRNDEFDVSGTSSDRFTMALWTQVTESVIPLYGTESIFINYVIPFRELARQINSMKEALLS